ncbi:amino acid ABC transporter permease [Miniphocaeibacter halophilus]|uniref:Amino acid ABC transporter permease n=1 Tax=Miniphocaeibacter halophilus TaxID=2931922 RepID=A0AC61MQ12_9FIRM|nr:amino acid ABC transporter permease [Miniphocaeibacter halophilus]QQK07715.1 amino acid ABC transporter permease [Miniphocaeibacter halophilus]
MYILNIFKELSKGFSTTFLIFLLTLILSIPLGMIIYFLKHSKNKIISSITKIYITVMRGTPLMLQLMFVFYGPFYIFGMRSPDRFFAVIVAFVLNYAAYFAEIYRGGFKSIDKGQYEAANILGLTKWQTYKNIVIPQVFKNSLPAMTNEIITLVKDTSLAFAISVTETFTLAKSIANRDSNMLAFLAVGIFYFVFNYLVEKIMNKIENRYNYYR